MPSTSTDMKERNMPDATIENHGSIFLVRPHTEAATNWIDENVSDDAQFFGNALAVEHRYIEPLVEGMQADGLAVA